MAEIGTTREAVRQRYGQAALHVLDQGTSASCCGQSCGCGNADPVATDLYAAAELASVPARAAAASLGCGNPTALAELRVGEVVLDLGSGGGIDVLLSARRVGPTGKVYGLDMTEEMLALARQNAADSGAINVEFLQGHIEAIPLPDASVDLVISNCVINLSPDKGQVLREAFRVLKPSGRFAVSDVVVDGPVPTTLREHVELWVGCIAGALERRDYLLQLQEAGFAEIAIEATRFYTMQDLDDPTVNAWLDTQPAAERERLNRAFFSAFVRAHKPGV